MSAIERLLENFKRSGRRPLRILGASGQLGYGIPTPALAEGLSRKPDMIGCDMGSIDIGPAYLGSGSMAPSRSGARRDLQKVLRAARSLDIPLIIGSAGSAGARQHLEETLAIIREIASEDRLHFSLVSIAADIPRDVVKRAIAEGRITPMDSMPDLTDAEVDATENLVGQMGSEAFRRALELVPTLLSQAAPATRAYSPRYRLCWVSPTGLAIHMSKIVECASLCCVPGGRDPILGVLDDDGFELESMASTRAATPASVAAHSLYEQANPFEIREPAGVVVLQAARFDAVDQRRTRVSGADFIPAARLTIKLEGARFVGHRVVLLCASADQRFIARQHELLGRIQNVVQSLVCDDQPKDYDLTFRVYGVDGVSRADIDLATHFPTEIFILGQCIASSVSRAEEVILTTKQYLLHLGFDGRLSTAGNLAFPFTPPELSVGKAYRFNVYHLMEVSDLSAHFPVSVENV